jgi:hypothetical protein
MDSSPTPPSLYLTVSTLIERDRLKEYKDLYKAFTTAIDDKKQRRTIHKAIQPMFDDISDRERHIFFDEHLIDAENETGSKADVITLEIPRTIRWLTEEQRWQFDAGASWELPGVTCRYFWFVHSNRDISYHLSLHIPYKHDAKHYYALALLQKLFFPSEEPDAECMAESFRLDVVSINGSAQTEKENLADFLERKFGEHVGNILPGPNKSWWTRLALEKPADANKYLFSPEFSRAAFLLRDDFFDRTLRKPGQALAELASRSARSTPTHGAGIPSDVYRDVDIAGLSDAALALIFLSGFLQNIIDFLEQDELEYNDAIEPLYPEGKMKKDPHFLLYATEDSIFEIVASSRSLEKGSQYIGICPYLFLVHVTVFHDESLVRRFEKSVCNLTNEIEAKTDKFSNFDKLTIEQLDEVVSIFHRGRFGIFGEVERYLHINTFLYSTEQAFYKAIGNYRYIEGRLNHWDGLLNELSSATGGAHELARQKTERRMDRILFFIAGFSIFQVLFAMTQSLSGLRFGQPESSAEATKAAAIDFKPLADLLDVGFIVAAIALVVFATTEYMTSRKRRK